MPEPYEFCGEPMYAPQIHNGGNKVVDDDIDHGEDSGYVLSILYNGKTDESEMIILQANDVAGGPICRTPLVVAKMHGHLVVFCSVV
jgi:carotenoid cleavage dioxygenase-like enzyme